MKKLLLSFLGLTFALLTWADPSGIYQVSKTLLNYESASYTFAGGEQWSINSVDNEDSWNCEFSFDNIGGVRLYNLLGYDETLFGKYNVSTGKLAISPQTIYYYYENTEYGLGICGGVQGYTKAQCYRPFSMLDFDQPRFHDFDQPRFPIKNCNLSSRPGEPRGRGGLHRPYERKTSMDFM